jgi:hypothetical protein
MKTVAGQIAVPPGFVVTAATARLVNVDEPMFAANVGRTKVDSAGRFSFVVREGRYRVFSEVAGPLPKIPFTQEHAWAESDVTLTETPLADLRLRLELGVTISGRIVVVDAFQASDVAVGAADGPGTLAYEFGRAAWSGGGTLSNVGVPVRDDGTFAIVGLPPGRYRLGLDARPPRLFTVKSITLSGREIPSAVIDVGRQDLAGLVVTASSRSIRGF